MDPITAVFILVGFSALLVGCAGLEDDNKVHLEIEPIPEEESEKAVQTEGNKRQTKRVHQKVLIRLIVIPLCSVFMDMV